MLSKIIDKDKANESTYNTEVLKSSVCDYKTHAAFKNGAPFIKCIAKIDGTTVDDAKDLDLVMPMYNH